jgi:hypothetical protein
MDIREMVDKLILLYRSAEDSTHLATECHCCGIQGGLDERIRDEDARSIQERILRSSLPAESHAAK